MGRQTILMFQLILNSNTFILLKYFHFRIFGWKSNPINHVCHVICVLYMTLVHSFFFSRKIVFENFCYGLKEMFLALVSVQNVFLEKNFLVYVNGSLRKWRERESIQISKRLYCNYILSDSAKTFIRFFIEND